ncbi:hypothetical protein ACFDR9_003671 [Janthinobacterium sp. CG_23.3]|uniref:hypothetical protein n=1 Tax=Janthinobacterium sp. CG_23.3 TaxID=3349634 RepID=UPI0038D45915
MRKAVIGVAAAATLLAAYFAPEDEGGVVGPAAATTRERPAAPTLAAGLQAIAREAGPDLTIHPRSVADDDLGNVFAKHSWQPETPKKIMLAQAEPVGAKLAAAAPGAPPLPFQFLGRFVDEGKAAYFLQADGRNLVARVGEKVDEHYTLDSASGDALHFTYVPLNQQQSLVVGDVN